MGYQTLKKKKYKPQKSREISFDDDEENFLDADMEELMAETMEI